MINISKSFGGAKGSAETKLFQLFTISEKENHISD